MEKPNDGGPAFPLPNCENSGMSLRDWFAGQAVQGLLSSNVHGSPAEFAAKSYLVADAMIAARSK